MEYHNQMDFREYHNQKDCNIQNDCQGVPQSGEMLGSTKIKMTASVFTIKKIPRSITIKMTAREYSKIVLSGIITIKTTAMEHSN